MRRRRWAVAPVLSVLLATALAGCSDQQEAYCEALVEEQQALTELADSAGEGGVDVLTPTLESFERLRTAAPDEVRDEWNTLVAAYESLEDAVQIAGIDPGQYDPAEPPPGLSRAEARRLRTVADKLSSFRVIEAAQGIEEHADAVCDVAFTG